MYSKTKAFVISSLKFGEADLIVKCYTQSHGMLSFLVKGVRKSRKSSIKVSYFQALSHLEIEFIHRPAKNLQFFKEVQLHSYYPSVNSDIYKSTLSLFLAEILQSCIQEEESNKALYAFIENTLRALDQAEKIGHFHLMFLLQLSEYLGFLPNNEDQLFPYFNLIDGVFQLKETNSYCFSGPEVEDLKQLLVMNYSHSQDLAIPKQRRLQLLDVLLLYYEIQIHGFKKPVSYGVLQEIFS